MLCKLVPILVPLNHNLNLLLWLNLQICASSMRQGHGFFLSHPYHEWSHYRSTLSQQSQEQIRLAVHYQRWKYFSLLPSTMSCVTHFSYGKREDVSYFCFITCSTNCGKNLIYSWWDLAPNNQKLCRGETIASIVNLSCYYTVFVFFIVLYLICTVRSLFFLLWQVYNCFRMLLTTEFVPEASIIPLSFAYYTDQPYKELKIQVLSAPCSRIAIVFIYFSC
jgi:hypothetical protein